MEKHIYEGKTSTEAIEKGLKELNLKKDDVEINIIKDEKRSFFSILAPRVVKVELTVKENVKETKKETVVEKKELKEVSDKDLEIAETNAKAFLDDFAKSAKITMEYNITRNPYGLNVELNGEDVSFLIGYRGETLYAFQNILASVASKGLETRVRLILDIEGYKAKREKTLEELAEKIAKTVVKTRRDVTLEPMKAYERKIIHSKLQNNSKVTTKSIGEEPRRRVVITLIK